MEIFIAKLKTHFSTHLFLYIEFFARGNENAMMNFHSMASLNTFQTCKLFLHSFRDAFTSPFRKEMRIRISVTWTLNTRTFRAFFFFFFFRKNVSSPIP